MQLFIYQTLHYTIFVDNYGLDFLGENFIFLKNIYTLLLKMPVFIHDKIKRNNTSFSQNELFSVTDDMLLRI